MMPSSARWRFSSLTHFGESAVRAYKIAMTPPMAPVLLVLDTEMQEGPIPEHEKLVIPKLPRTAPVVGDPGAVAECAQLLVDASNPVVVAAMIRPLRSTGITPQSCELADKQTAKNGPPVGAKCATILSCGPIAPASRATPPRRAPLQS
jgi:thiamine pyrophosphate-dependent acetolactate synthase large subunit-like protein